MVIPTVPSFVANDTSLLKLQQLSAAVTWLAVAQSRPMWRYYRTTGQTFSSATTWAVMNFPTVGIDTDNTWTSAGFATIQTQGYYAVDGCVPVVTGASQVVWRAYFLWTAGSNNAHYTNGTTMTFGGAGDTAIGTASQDCTLNISDIVPVVCYPGDTIKIETWFGSELSSMTTDTCANNAGVVESRFLPQFTGMFIRTGS